MSAKALLILVVFFGWSVLLSGQVPETRTTAQPPQAATTIATKHRRSAVGDIGSGTGDVAKGLGKGAGNVAVGAGKGAVDLVTLHPLNAAADIGKGGVSAGKNVAVGTVKGMGKIARGTGTAIRKIL